MNDRKIPFSIPHNFSPPIVRTIELEISRSIFYGASYEPSFISGDDLQATLC